MDRFVDVFEKSTGQPRRVPAHWMNHPTLGKPFRKTPKAPRSGDIPAADPATPSTDVDPTPVDTPTTETPAAGDKE